MNAERRQASSTAQLIFGIEHLVEFITFVMTLEPGDIISTGTPAGVAPLKHGDVVTVKGTLAADKDFGAGYLYEVIIENAKVQ